MKKWLLIGAVLLVLLLFVIFLVFGSRFFTLYASMDGENAPVPPTSPVEDYVRVHWPQYEYSYESASQCLTLIRQTNMEIDTARRVGGNVYVETLAPETYLENVSAIAIDVISHCDCPELTVNLQYTSVEGECIFSVSSNGEIYTCWEEVQ